MLSPELLTIINVVLTATTLTLSYLNYKHTRVKDFQDNLYKVKFETYRRIINECLEVWQQLDINSTPFVQIYDFKSEAKWREYYEKEVSKLIHLGFGIQRTIFKETTFLPSVVMDELFNFSNECIRFVVLASHFDTGIIIQKQDELHELFFSLVNAIRKDLGIDFLDESIGRRMGSS